MIFYLRILYLGVPLFVGLNGRKNVREVEGKKSGKKKHEKRNDKKTTKKSVGVLSYGGFLLLFSGIGNPLLGGVY